MFSPCTKAMTNNIGSENHKRRFSYWTIASSVLLIAIALGVGWYMNNPTPDGISNPWKYKMLVAAKRFSIDVAYAASFLTSSHHFRIFHHMVDWTVDIFANSPPEVPGSNIRSSVTTFGGFKVRLYEPMVRKQPGLGPALVYMHGGGFVIGSAVMFDTVTRRLAEELDCVVVSIDYRLAPEHPFPAGFEDCLNTTKWLMDNALQFNVDRLRISVIGDSAGGAFAAAVSQKLHDAPAYPDIAFQILIYPVTQLIDNHTPAALMSLALFGKSGSIVTWQEAGMFTCMYLLGREDDAVMWALINNTHMSEDFWKHSPLAQYVNHTLVPLELRAVGQRPTLTSHLRVNSCKGIPWEQIERTAADERASPLLRKNMSDLPPTFVSTCGFDPVRDHGVFYVHRLREAGVPVRWEHYRSGFHGIFGPTWPLTFEVGEKMFKDIVVFAKEQLAIKVKVK